MAFSKENIKEFFGAQFECLNRRGKNHFNSENVLSLTYDKEYNHLEGRVHASKRKTSYQIEIELDLNGKLKSGKCACTRGQATCSHMAALLRCARERVSPTDISCQWSKRKKPDDDRVRTIAEIYHERSFKPNYPQTDPEKFEQLRRDLQDCPGGSGAGVLFFLEPEPDPEPEADRTQFTARDVIEIVLSDEFGRASEPEGFLLELLTLSPEEIIAVADSTKNQASSPEWARVRRGRLTASKLGPIIRFMRKGGSRQPPPSLMSSLLYQRSLDGVKSVLWGRTHEKTAIKEYSEDNQKTVVKTGIWLHECGILGASPDGLIDDDTIIEVKCPYSLRKEKLEEALRLPKYVGKYVLYCREGKWQLDRDHDYFHQIQAGLYFTNRKQGVLYLYTSVGSLSVSIAKEPSWEANIGLLKQFYFQYFVPYVLSQRSSLSGE